MQTIAARTTTAVRDAFPYLCSLVAVLMWSVMLVNACDYQRGRILLHQVLRALAGALLAGGAAWLSWQTGQT